MKLLFSLIAVLMLNKECNQKQSDSQETLALKETLSNQQTSGLKITYKVNTRGFFEILWIDKNSITLSKDRNLIKTSTYKYPEKDWQELTELLSTVDIKNLPNLEAPSQKFQWDGAAMTTLKISVDDEDYETPIFDNGNPPKAIESIVNKLLTIKKSVE